MAGQLVKPLNNEYWVVQVGTGPKQIVRVKIDFGETVLYKLGPFGEFGPLNLTDDLIWHYRIKS